MKGTNIFKSIIEAQIRFKHGRIHWSSNGWIFGFQGATNRQGVHIGARKDADGVDVSLGLNKRSTSNCPLREYQGVHPRTEDGYWVPAMKCRACVHHLKRRRGQPYACCAMLRDLRAAEPQPLEKLSEMMEQAADHVRKILST